ncbi:hypothetical protein [Abyssalbus ytuae]|uniref:Uncharacterized protein n=1 Tax=Abyssalbus ytuae TaxID=2926907 RepID=A0A9E6ZMM5_9FLAO|nr:hypothetical protein [Abyssalbus ytuae]UOB17479.1 hypothetical protein MQE35_17300 [Abyssalbus ytuae]
MKGKEDNQAKNPLKEFMYHGVYEKTKMDELVDEEQPRLTKNPLGEFMYPEVYENTKMDELIDTEQPRPIILYIQNGKLIKEEVDEDLSLEAFNLSLAENKKSAIENGVQYTDLGNGEYLITVFEDSKYYNELEKLIEKLERGEEVDLDKVEMTEGLKDILSLSLDKIEEKIEKNQKRDLTELTKTQNQSKVPQNAQKNSATQGVDQSATKRHSQQRRPRI